MMSYLDYECVNTKVKFLLQKKISRVYSENKYVWSCSSNTDLGVSRFLILQNKERCKTNYLPNTLRGPQIGGLERSPAIGDRFSTLSDGILAFTMANVTGLFKICLKVLIVSGCHAFYLNRLMIDSKT